MNEMLALFHVTPSANLLSIARIGIDPDFSEGKLKRSWYCEETALVWAFAHVAARRDLKLSDLAALRVLVSANDVQRTRWADVYTSKIVLAMQDAYGVERALRDHEYALATTERNRKRFRELAVLK